MKYIKTFEHTNIKIGDYIMMRPFDSDSDIRLLNKFCYTTVGEIVDLDNESVTLKYYNNVSNDIKIYFNEIIDDITNESTFERTFFRNGFVRYATAIEIDEIDMIKNTKKYNI